MSSDLDPLEVAAALGRRPVRTYPAMLSTEPDAMAWARSGAPAGALVVADYQASPRGRGGWPWQVQAGRGLGFSLVLRPDLPPEREGWLYVAVSLALGDVLAGEDARFDWPDAVTSAAGTPTLARLGVYVQLGPHRTDWAVATVLVEDASPPRAPLLARLVAAVEARLAEPADPVLAAYRPRCVTLGRDVRARLIPLGPGGPEVTGEAVDVLADGALVLLTRRGNRVAVPPLNLGLLEPPEQPVEH
ncbi:MAG: hypothetical protein M3P96_06215 [Actinomycetota bacterium]|nr:hypothetical protein [Actinomycetota bacterium]